MCAAAAAVFAALRRLRFGRRRARHVEGRPEEARHEGAPRGEAVEELAVDTGARALATIMMSSLHVQE